MRWLREKELEREARARQSDRYLRWTSRPFFILEALAARAVAPGKAAQRPRPEGRYLSIGQLRNDAWQ